MKYKSLRTFMKKKNLSRPFTYANKPLVIDGECFKELYKNSGCEFILGGEYDRFASYLKNILSIYIKSNIDCYVVFKGAMIADIKTRIDIHKKIIDRVDSLHPENTEVYCEPIFLREVYKDVLDELGIKYYICMHDSREVLFSLAKKLDCPILSSNFEYAFYNISVIKFQSVVFDERTQSISCSIYHSNACRQWTSTSNDVLTVALVASDEDSEFYHILPGIFKRRPEHYMASLHHWIKRQNKENALRMFRANLKEVHMEVFMKTYQELFSLFVSSPYPQAEAVLTSIERDENKRATLPSEKQFEYDISVGRVAIPFINLKKIGTLSGSWVVGHKNREDAMLVVADIALYAQGLLTGSQDTKITFIGRKHSKTETRAIKKFVNIKKKPQENIAEPIDFQNFLTDHLRGFTLTTLEAVPQDCWILLISLLYYSTHVKRDITKEVCCILLSYVLLGPVSENVGVIKRSNFFVIHGDQEKTDTCGNSLTLEHSTNVASAVIDLFYLPKSRLIEIFDRRILHTFAKIQHCLQYMNYLNRLCGEGIKCTAYHRAINCTFIYNLYIALKDESSPTKYIKSLLNCTPVYIYFKNILNTYLKCLACMEP